MKKIYNKLVRDKIPDIILKDQKICKTKILLEQDYKELLKKIPSEFSGIDLCSILYMNIRGSIFKLDEIYKIDLTEDEIIHVYNGAFKNPSRENINKLNEPLYKRNIDEDELIHGDLSSHDIDQIFKEQYNRSF